MPSSITPSKRARLYELSQQGWSVRRIAEHFGVSGSTISKTVTRYKILGNFNDSPRSGRPRLLSDRDSRHIVRAVTSADVFTVPEVQGVLQIGVSDSTVRRALYRAGLHGRVKISKPLLTIKHKTARHKWAQIMAAWHEDALYLIVFSDESRYELFGSAGRQYCWRKTGQVLEEKHVKKTVKHGGGGIMVWGCITFYGVGMLHRCTGIVNTAVYQGILNGPLQESLDGRGLEREHVIFQQDNAPCHKSRGSMTTISELGINVLDWPAQSPDMNIIENVWAHLETKIRKHHPLPTNLDQLWEALQEEWYSIDLDFIQNLYRSFSERVKVLQEVKGSYTRW